MEVRIGEFQPLVANPRSMPEYRPSESQVIMPVKKSGGSVSKKVGENQTGSSVEDSSPPMDPKEMEEIAKEAQTFLDDLSIGLNFNVEEKSGEVVVKLVNRETGEVIRQIPSEDLLKLRQKLEELRGVLFDAKV